MTNAAEMSAAQRCADTVNLHIVADPNNAGKWVAIKLADGTSDNVVYDTRRDAIKHQLHETLCAYLCIPPDGMHVNEAVSFLRFNRQLYDAGGRMTDPDQPEYIMPQRIEHL